MTFQPMPSTLTRSRLHKYQTPGLLPAPVEPAQESPATLIVPALLFYEGKHVSMDGSTNTFSAKTLESIVQATNQFMAGGRRIKVYASDDDHLKISQGTTIGFLVGELRLETITAEALPMPGLTDLVGKQGIYANVQISGQANIDQYQDGRLKELSVAIDAGGVLFGIKNLMYEVSAVGIPSLAGAALFSLPNLPDATQAIAHARATIRYALTLADQLAEDAIQRAEAQLWNLFDNFMETLWDIREAADNNPDALNGQTPEALRSQAVEDFITQLRNRMQVATPQPQPQTLPTVPLFGVTPMPDELNPQPETPTVEQFSALQSENKALRERVEAMELRQTVTSKFAQLKDRAIALRDGGKLTPAEYTALFGKEEESIQRFAQPGNQELGQIEFYLSRLEAAGKPIQFGMPVEGNNLEDKGKDPAQEEADDFLKGYTPKKSY